MFPSEINDLLSNYFKPILMLVIFMGVGIGIAKNFDAISDSSGTGRRKEGIISTVYIAGGVILAIALLTLVGTKIAGFDPKF